MKRGVIRFSRGHMRLHAKGYCGGPQRVNKLLKLMTPSYMNKTWVFGFGTFLELAWHLQSTRSRRLINSFGWFLVLNKAESLLVLFLLLPTHFCWVENSGNCQGSKKLCFFLVETPSLAPSPDHGPWLVDVKMPRNYIEIIDISNKCTVFSKITTN